MSRKGPEVGQGMLDFVEDCRIGVKVVSTISGTMGRSLDKTSKWAKFSKFLVGGWVGGFENRSWF